MDTLSTIISNFLNDPAHDFVALLAALVLITWGITLAINRWDAFKQQALDED
jgi:hypothetical protein